MTDHAKALAEALAGLLAYYPNGATFERMGFGQKPAVEAHKTAVAALAAYRAEPAGWRPVETAPKDGTRVLLYRSEYAEDMAVGWWNTTWDCWQLVHGAEFPDCTHWLPLPPSPEEA